VASFSGIVSAWKHVDRAVESHHCRQSFTSYFTFWINLSKVYRSVCGPTRPRKWQMRLGACPQQKVGGMQGDQRRLWKNRLKCSPTTFCHYYIMHNLNRGNKLPKMWATSVVKKLLATTQLAKIRPMWSPWWDQRILPTSRKFDCTSGFYLHNPELCSNQGSAILSRSVGTLKICK
jgi:hypothetical protein